MSNTKHAINQFISEFREFSENLPPDATAEETQELYNQIVSRREKSMTTKHTPGPWYVEGFNPPRINAMDGLDCIAQCDNMKEEMSRDEEMANARLIAAAPDLLAACVALLPWVIDHRSEIDAEVDNDSYLVYINDAIAIARAAITKATGESK